MRPDLLALVITLGIASGLALLIDSIVGSSAPPGPPSALSRRFRRLLNGRTRQNRRSHRLRFGAVVAIMIGVWLFTGLPVVGAIAGIALVGVPWLMAIGNDAIKATERLEAVEAWTRHLSGRVAVGYGLLQAISLTARTAPSLIAPDVRELAARLQAGWTPRNALLAFADALDDTTSDMVVLALLGHLSERGERLTDILDDQADSAAAEVAKRRDVYAKRAEPRLVTRFLTGLTVLMVIGGFAVPTYPQPYLTLRGQVLLAVFAVMCIAVMRWVRHLGRSTRGPRLLSPALVSEEAR
jgi:Flp pilus assembly protein TadB